MSNPDQKKNPSGTPTWDDVRITEYAMGELRGAERDSFEDEIASNPELKAAVVQAQSVTSQLTQLMAGENTGRLDSDRRNEIFAVADKVARPDPSEVSQSDAPNPTTSAKKSSITAPAAVREQRSRFAPWLLAIAALVLLTLGIIPAMQRSKLTQSGGANGPDANGTGEQGWGEQAPLTQNAAGSQPALEQILEPKEIEQRISNPRLFVREEEEQTLIVDETRSAIIAAKTHPTMDESGMAASPDYAELQVTETTAAHDRRLKRLPRQNLDSMDTTVELTEIPEIQLSIIPATPSNDPLLAVASDTMSDPSAMPHPTTATEPAMPGQPSMPSVRSGVAPVPAPSPVPAPLRARVQAPTSIPTELSLRRYESLARNARGGTVSESDVNAPARPSPTTSTRRMFGTSLSTLESKVRSGESVPGEAVPIDAGPIDAGPIVYPDGRQWEMLHRTPVNRDKFEPIFENEFKSIVDNPLSTFSVDVDTASYSKVRRFLNDGSLPRPDAVRIEEMVNYFDYQYEPPAADSEHPFATHVTIAQCPWNSEHRLARVAIQGKTIEQESRPPCNLVFLIDTSGSMNSPNKLPLVLDGMKMLTKQLGEKDRVAIVVYAGSAGLALKSTSAGKKKPIKRALAQLKAGGSTNGGAGISLAYSVARDSFIEGGVNRVVLCTDGDFNVGLSGTDELVRLVKDESSGGIFLTALGFGMGNHNDAMMEKISGEGNGNYAFIDSQNEAQKVLVRQTESTLVTIAKDVKIQIEFNRRIYSKYRLIGYENRVLAREDFNNDKKDAGEIGAGHQVTALYELVPSTLGDSSEPKVAQEENVDPLRYQTKPRLTEAAFGDDALTVKLRYKRPDGEVSTLIQFDAKDSDKEFESADSDFQFTASVASFGMLLRQSRYRGDWTLTDVRQVAESNLGEDEFGLRAEFLRLVQTASHLSGE